MSITELSPAELVVAAQNGDERARTKLVNAYLPLVYNIVRRALGRNPDVDDVVQEVLLRVVRDLHALRDPSSFRPWLATIAIRQISSYRHRARADMTIGLDEMGEAADTHLDSEDRVILRLQLAAQRHQVAEASGWLDPEDRVPLSLWWQENVGWLTRSEVAAALGLTVAHTGVRLQRMREQLDLSRAIVCALAADPRCAQLDAVISHWDGARTSVWRKRIARHVRDCPECAATMTGQVPLEQLLIGAAPLAVPVGLGLALAAKGLLPAAGAQAAGLAVSHPAPLVASAKGVHATLIGKLAHAVTTYSMVSVATGAALAVGATATYVAWPDPPKPAVVAGPTSPSPAPIASSTPSRSPVPPSPTASPASRRSASPRPSAVAAAVAVGSRSLESVAAPGQYLTFDGDFAAVGAVGVTADQQTRQRATFAVTAGLADTTCVTFRATDGRYLRHSELRLRLSPADGSRLFREDATFCPIPGAVAGSVTLRAYNYPALRLRCRDGAVYIDPSDGSGRFGRESSFIVRTPWAG
ncbi:RNA polymerase sigma factor (sigma-70 family) [Allocatelliglobosispora scoriae]|uniref:RNA polymerase sigma factor (Sigma-70 family) n=1 Tax=Allocatelliglobosispora scoriae TaxID=643052 RepID=A0A841BHW3_9ACTN|nr:sigma-70 family RNA polymerase sigma factor [Allocatelliglobosispora scoriae]MBB5866766.1 RNA polymerase sigma factor (sigma-70 family) [Allocatelliglobosispora scoriae]